MDIKSDPPLPGVLYANVHRQLLVEHSFAVGFVAECLHESLIPNKNPRSESIFIGGCLHDVGKVEANFQSWVINPNKKDFMAEDGQHIDDAKFNFDKHPRHNEISVLFYHFLDNERLKSINPKNKELIKHVIYWHHAKPFRKEKGFETYKDIYSKLSKHLKEGTFENLLQKVIQLLKEICVMDKKYRNISLSLLAESFDENIVLDKAEGLENIHLPKYKSYDAKEEVSDYSTPIKDNAIKSIARACIITADRLISALTSTDLHNHIKNNTLNELVNQVLFLESNLCSHIEKCLTQFSDSQRTSKQREVANQLANIQGIAVLAGAAGCGKTKIALEWAKLKQAKQIFWICPRVQVCQGLFYELTSDQYLPNANIEINTSEFKFINLWRPIPEDKHFSGDIVITTIDQIINAIITHNKADILIDFLNVHVVFDEFHEYVNMPGFNLLFAELVNCKKQQSELANTLLVSATPHYFYVKEILELHTDDIVTMPSFNRSLYHINFKIFDDTKINQTNPLYEPQKTNTIVISNTALTAQKSFIHNQHQENAVLLHSKFKKSDKRKWFDKVYNSFKKNGTKEFDILRSGPIVQSSLNITCNNMVTEIVNAEDFLQRLGRLDRFGDNTTVNIFCIAVPEAIHLGKGIDKSTSARFLSHKNILNSTKAWYKILKGALDEKPITLQFIYALYEKFHELDETKKSIETDLLGALKTSVELINQKVFDPIYISLKKRPVNSRVKIKKISLRGDNRFVQMAVCDVSDPTRPKFIDEYAYQIPINEQHEIDNLTASCDLIQGYSDSRKSLLVYMMKKHHNIMGGKKTHKDFILLNEARQPESPIYLSYIPSHLSLVGGESVRHSEAIYYAVCDKQPIGAISIKQLTNNGD